ncbi:MAG TPA: VCBS repeat-containing protein [Microscillaceae bacterium]|nr:VCBS repeat-containing protein [Microscillaceae bacterium]
MQHIKYFGWFAILLMGLQSTHAQFKEVKTNIVNLKYSSVAWGDQDNDGDLDIFIMGWDGKARKTLIYSNENGQFEDIEAGLPGVNSVASNNLAWADLDNDNDLDLVVTGQDGSERIAKMFSNEGSGYFKEMPQSLGGVYASTVVWGDYDNDGDLDLLMAGHMKNQKRETLVFRNDNGKLVRIDAKLQGISRGTAAWGDYDNDGDLDILVSGRYHPNKKLSKCIIYQNNNGVFTDIKANLTGISRGSSAWGDYDNDGDLDLLMSGLANNGKRITKLYKNNNGRFVDTRANLIQVSRSSLAWGDYDNDGDLDILIMGFDNAGERVTKLYQNNNGSFKDVKAKLMGLCAGSVAWGDYDNDGDLDILISGEDNDFNQHTKIYQNTLNNGQTVKIHPPANLQADVKGKNVLLKWEKIKDLKGITYNIRIGTAPGKNDRLSPMADAQSGRRLVADEGNAHHHDNWLIKNLPPGKYYWSVQTINGAFKSSKFSEEKTFTVN